MAQKKTAQKKKMYKPHYSTAKDLRIVQTRQSIKEAFLTLLKDKTLDQITIREVAARAGIGYNTFFRHHNSKEELIQEIAANEIKQLHETAVAVFDTTTSSAEASEALCRYVAENDALWSTLLTGGAANTLREEFIRRSFVIAEEKITSTDTIPAEIGVKLAAAGTFELLVWWLEQTERMPVEQLAAIYHQLIVMPLLDKYLN